MAGKIPNDFIDQVMARVDIVDIIDRRLPLTRKGKEFQACCPFHEEKTPSFTVSPSKQFYHCFGCGAHGTAIGFLMEYANLGFVEAVEELADGAGLPMPQHATGTPTIAGESVDDLLKTVEQAKHWFQQQLRQHTDAALAVDYLQERGLSGKIAADFGIGFAPDSWNALAQALAATTSAQQKLLKTGLIAQKDNANHYDRFRKRIIFPIEDHRGRVVAFGGRILGAGEPKYLNSPETPLFHKGAELYGLHRARRAIGKANKSIVVEGYMDVISLAQFEVDNVVATLGTATTRIHLQRLFRLAPEVIFCFDGDRAGRAAAWKALQVSLPEMQDGRQIGFLFLPDGEDPDTIVRLEGAVAFGKRVQQATPLPDFLFENLSEQIDMTRMDGKARLVSLVKPLISELPVSAFKEMMLSKLSSLSGLNVRQLGTQQTNSGSRLRYRNMPSDSGQISLLAFATSLLLQNPQLALAIDDFAALQPLRIKGAEVLINLIKHIQNQPDQTTARLLELFRDSAYHGYLQKLAARPTFINDDALETQFKDTIQRLLESQQGQDRQAALEKLRQKNINELQADEKSALITLLNTRNKES